MTVPKHFQPLAERFNNDVAGAVSSRDWDRLGESLTPAFAQAVSVRDWDKVTEIAGADTATLLRVTLDADTGSEPDILDASRRGDRVHLDKIRLRQAKDRVVYGGDGVVGGR